MEPNSILYTDTFKTYNALDVSNFHHMRVNHSELFVDKGNQINGIENFWNQAKRRLRRRASA
jgi:transposase